MQIKIEVRLVAPNKIESMNPSRFDMAIVRNLFFTFSFYIYEEDYFIHILCLITSMISNFNRQRLLAKIEALS